jgi:hypothetical protein
VDPRRAPQRVLSTQSTDQLAQPTINSRPPGPLPSFPAPIGSKARRLPAHDRLELHHLDRAKQVPQSTVSKYMTCGRKPPSQSWKTFLRNHAEAIAAIGLCVVPTVIFDRLFAFLVVGHRRRQLLWFEACHPTAEWLARQITEASPWASAPGYLVRDNDRAYGRIFTARVGAMGIRDWPISFGSPWQNGIAERGKNAPFERAVQRIGSVIAVPVLGGLHHRYVRI